MADSIVDKVLISCSWDSTQIVGVLPEEFMISLETEYSNPITGASSEMIQAIAQKTLDTSLFTNNDLFHVWMGSHPLQISFEMLLVPQNNFTQDLVQPLRELMKLSAARAGENQKGFFLASPIPDNGQVSVRFGSILHLDNVLITNVSPSPARPLLVGGYPSKINVSVTLRTKKVMTHGDVDRWVFPNAGR